MSITIEHTSDIDRPISKVFHFMATQHVQNHPRWDDDIELEQVSDGPIGVGTVIRRRNRRGGTMVEGTMEVIEFEPNMSFGVVIRDGPMEIRSRITFEALGDAQTRVTTFVELPGVDESLDKSFLMSRLERSAQNRRRLIEAET